MGQISSLLIQMRVFFQIDFTALRWNSFCKLMQRYLKLLRYALPHRAVFLLILGLTLSVAALTALQPWPMKLIVDHLLQKIPLPDALKFVLNIFSVNSNPAALLSILVVSGLALFLLSSLLDVALSWSWTVAGRRIVNDLAQTLFARLQRRSIFFHSRNEVGDSISRVMVDSWCVYQILDALVFGPLHAVLIIFGMVLLMASLDPTLTLMALVIAPLMVGASLVMGKPLRAAAKLKREIETRIQSHIQQTLTGIPVVQAFVQEEREQERFQTFAAAAIQAQQRSTFLGSISGLSSGLIATLGTGAILFVGARFVSEGRLTIGGILVFLVYLNSLQAQMKILAGVYPAAQNYRASVDRIVEVLEAEPEVLEKSGAIFLATSRGHIQIQNATCGYEKGQPVLRDVSLEICPGQVLAIVGATGAGKSTLASLIPRFLDPWKGLVSIDGKDLRELQLKSLRSQIAIVLQEPFLLPLSIAENIAYGRLGASRQEIEHAARLANAHLFVERLPHGYDTVIGERGATLSGGERQRLSIARALLKNAPILILDEPTSALDAQTETAILEALERLMESRTTLIIAHRLSTIRRADNIVVLKDGQIQESGTHSELLARGAAYAHFYNLQFHSKPEPVAAVG
jgi:ATP-binding cassette subfamily B protein